MKNKIQYARKAKAHCQAIKSAINALCEMMDITDEDFREADKLKDYKSIFQKADAWERNYDHYIKKAGKRNEKE